MIGLIGRLLLGISGITRRGTFAAGWHARALTASVFEARSSHAISLSFPVVASMHLLRCFFRRSLLVVTLLLSTGVTRAQVQTPVDGEYGGPGKGGLYEQVGNGPVTGPIDATLFVSGGGLLAPDAFGGGQMTILGALVDAGGGLYTVRATELSYPFDMLGIPSATVFYIRQGSITATNRSGGIVTWLNITSNAPQAPEITQQPQDLVLSGEITQSLNVLARGAVPLAYQWYRNGQAQPGLTVNLLVLAAQPSHVGKWYCVVSNSVGVVTSRVAQVRVDAPPPKVSLPATFELVLGAAQGFGVIVTGGQEPYTYAWEKDGVSLPAETGFSLTFPAVTAANAGTYRCTVTDGFGNVAIAGPTVATVQLPPAPRFMTKLAPVKVPAGNSLQFVLRLESQTAAVPTAVWRRNGVPQSGGSVTFDNGTGLWLLVFSIADAQPTDSGSWDCVATGPGGVATSDAVAVLVKAANAPDTVDLTFDAGTANRGAFNNPGGDGQIEGLAIQADDKILVTGNFQQWNGQARTNLVRLNVDGSVDSAFAAHHFTARVNGDLTVPAVAVAPDGRIYVAGIWQQFDGVDDGASFHLLRLLPNGTLDQSFALPALTSAADELVILGDGTVYNNGLRLVNNAPHYLLKFPAGGSADLSFDAGYTAARFSGDTVGAMVANADGGLTVGGFFGVTQDDFPFFNLARLKPDGRLDTSFRSPLHSRDIVTRLVRQADGKIVAVGDFADSGGNVRRFLENGAFDPSFSSPVKDAAFSPLSLTSRGAILVAPNTGNELARLNADGSVDDTFTVVVNNDIRLSAVDSKGRIVIAGFFTEVRGAFDDVAHAVARRHLARLTGEAAGGGGGGQPAPVTLGGVTRTPGGAVAVSFPTQVGFTYTLEKQTGLGSGIWNAAGSVVGDGSVKTLEGATSGSSAFFRIRIQP